MGNGSDLGGAITPGNVLIVSEEPRSLWRDRVQELGIGDHCEFLSRPFKGRPSQADWGAFIEWLSRYVMERRCALVIVDTLAAVNPVTDENDSARMMEVLTPLHRVTDAGAGVVLAHHLRKGDAGEAQASRGSGALPSFVDIILELRRYDAGRATDRRRVLTAYSRFDVTPPELVVELMGHTLPGLRNQIRRDTGGPNGSHPWHPPTSPGRADGGGGP